MNILQNCIFIKQNGRNKTVPVLFSLNVKFTTAFIMTMIYLINMFFSIMTFVILGGFILFLLFKWTIQDKSVQPMSMFVPQV